MTAPRKDGRTRLERARELRKLAPYEFHERSTEGLHALCWAMDVVEALAAAQHDPRELPKLQRAIMKMRQPLVTVGK